MTKGDLLHILEPFTDELDIEFNLSYKPDVQPFLYIKIDIEKGSSLVISDRELVSQNYVRVNR